MSDDRPDHEELQAIEEHRREILHRAELPWWRILMFWSGTCLEEMSHDMLVWFTLAVYCSIRVYAKFSEYVPEFMDISEKTNIGVLGGFLSFFLVLFVNQTNSRFLEMYGFSKACSGRIQDIAGLASTQLPVEVAEKLVKHMNAAQLAGYVGLNAIGQGSPYSKSNFFDVYNEKYQLLTPEEMVLLDHHDMDNSGSSLKELCTWCQRDVAEARKTGCIDSYQEQVMQDRILAFRASMDGMYDYTDQPPHFFYIHFLVLLSTLYLPLFAVDTAYSAGWGDQTYLGLDILNGLIVLLQCIFVIGLRELGGKMIDPYGDDDEDLSVILYVESTWENCKIILDHNKRASAKYCGLQAPVFQENSVKKSLSGPSDLPAPVSQENDVKESPTGPPSVSIQAENPADNESVNSTVVIDSDEEET
ncbi:hypothetical protein ACHAWF_007384 [Thalassiosira exigua]